jgi:glycosyltransferase involved in cell wall biosynthesis
MLYFTTIFKIIKTARKLKKANYQPDIIILEWSQILFLSTKIRIIFPNSIIIANEYDVSFLGQEREYLRIEKGFKKSLKNIKYLKMKKVELNSMTSCHLIVTQNVKDFELLLNEGIAKEKQLMIAPFFTNMLDMSRENTLLDIIFIGAMNRKENYLSAIWFIENVFNHIQDNRIKFIIIGANPHKSLFRYASKKIIITGYVSDINLYFSNSLCMVAPLVLGAGIKVKILEGLSAGIPILTNNIGIEGIPAKDEVHYIFCNTPNDYLNNIYRLINCTSYSKNISINAKHFMVDNFNYEKSFENYVKKINSLFIK